MMANKTSKTFGSYQLKYRLPPITTPVISYFTFLLQLPSLSNSIARFFARSFRLARRGDEGLKAKHILYILALVLPSDLSRFYNHWILSWLCDDHLTHCTFQFYDGLQLFRFQISLVLLWSPCHGWVSFSLNHSRNWVMRLIIAK